MTHQKPRDPDRPPNQQDGSVGELIQLAGKRQQVDAERTARVRTAVHARWQESLQPARPWQQNWARVAMAAAAVMILAMGLRFWLAPAGALPGKPSLPRVVALAGEAWVQEQEQPATSGKRSLTAGDIIPLGEEILTGSDSRIGLELADGVSVRLDAETRLTFTADTGATLAGGAVYVDTGRPAPGPAPVLEVRSPWGVVRDVGTQFLVRLTADSQAVDVREGAVSMESDMETFRVQAGTTLTLSNDGTTRSPSPADGPQWSWVTHVSPPQDLQGRTLVSFLEWVCREKGWRLRFADTRVARETQATILSGSTAGLSLDEALDVVLAATPFTYSAADGLLAIDHPGDTPVRP